MYSVRFLGFIALVFCLGLIEPASAQTRPSRSVTASPKPLTAEATQNTHSSIRREHYLERIGRIRDHHIGVELRQATKAMATERPLRRSLIKPKPRRVNVSKDVVLIDMGSITGTADLDYYWASPISEPTIAVAEYGMFATGNWYAARSVGEDQKFEFVDPQEAFGADNVGEGFCCDQVAIYDKSRQLMIWFMQGKSGDSGSNTIKFLVSKGEEAFKAGRWREYAYDSLALLGDEGVWLDFPDLALSNGFLYVTLNAFNSDDQFQYSAVMRLSLDALANGRDAELRVNLHNDFSLRMTQGNNLDRMYFAAHADTGQLAVYSWADSDERASGPHMVTVERWYQVLDSDTGNAEGPQRWPWIADRCDSRVTGGWATKSEIGFAWTAARDNRFFRPHARVAIISRAAIDTADESDTPITPIYEPHIWSNNVGIAYPSAGVNGAGQVGLSIAFAGPRNHPSHAVGFLRRRGEPANWSWQLMVTRAGLSGPKRIVDGEWQKFGVWGDYFYVRAHPTNPHAWVTVGYTLQNEGDEALKAVAEYTIFGARGSAAGVAEQPIAGHTAETREAGR